MDEAAISLGLDPVEIRRRNLVGLGEEFIPGDRPADGQWVDALECASKAIDWGRPLEKHQGQGIALGIKSSSTIAASFSMVRLHSDASVSILSGTSDMGQGARTVFTQLAAEELGVAPEQVTIRMGDTAAIPFDLSTSASRSTVYMGNAIVKACRELKAQMRKMAGEVFQLPENAISVHPGHIEMPDDASLSYSELLKAYYGPAGGEVVSVSSTRSALVPSHPLGGKAAFWELMCVAVELEVDSETGEVLIKKLVLAGDVGKALNPLQVEVQDDGSAVMGLVGHTLMEQLLLDDHGRVLNLGALDYRIPTTKDVPLDVHSILIENADGPGPFGSKGAGEGGILAVAPAVLADIYLSRDDQEAVRYDNEPEMFKDREQYRNFTELELSTLWAKMRGIEWNVNSIDEFHTVLEKDGGERCIKRLPPPMTDELACLTPEQISTAATNWAATDEMACEPADVQPIVEGLVRLAKIASAQDRKLYLWNCT